MDKEQLISLQNEVLANKEAIDKTAIILKNRLKDISSQIDEVRNYKDPFSTQGKIENLYNHINNIELSLHKIIQKLNAINLDERFIEIFTDEQLKELFIQSGLSNGDVKKYIDKEEGKDLSAPQVSRYVNGEVTDLMMRSKLGRFFKEAAIRSVTNVKAGKIS